MRSLIALDKEHAMGIMRGPLHGIPVLLKDLIDQDGVPTTAGSMAMQDSTGRVTSFACFVLLMWFIILPKS
jgi:Asp-tRNA(Asn)/Glu-tRNA(Gln) amidotransferase A subunit family amidase